MLCEGFDNKPEIINKVMITVCFHDGSNNNKDKIINQSTILIV